ncbi:hypothetical protein BC938DRAFT_482677 [Jimgerdemannia flammicorona]|uniref:VWFA domain-containing protein n=1 Tax=Jimgerdemannia flammicorona TaxID=994334 RepID=A0A433QWB3_9FUNG|nr:hypothetical protein BC938DRAFT_482677 [Jimgerdemannia flammicorona]
MQCTEDETGVDSPDRLADTTAAESLLNEEQKISDARTAILLVKNSRFFSRNEYSQWLLRYMYQPIAAKEYEDIQVLHISNSRKLHWSFNNTTPAKTFQSRNTSLSIFTTPPLTATTNGDISLPASNVATAVQTPTTPKYPAHTFNLSSNGGITPPYDVTAQTINQPIPKKLYRLNPQTRIFTIAKKYRMVFLVDVSSSLGTTDAGMSYGGGDSHSMRVKVLMSDVFETLQKCLDGIVRRFCIQTSTTNGSTVQPDPTLHITVVAECSQFVSNLNVIPLLAEFPTMRVLLGDVVVCSSNIRHVIQRLQSEFTIFQNQLADFRKDLEKKRPKMGYTLDVGHPTAGVGVTGDLLEPTKSLSSGKATSAPGISGKVKTAKSAGGSNAGRRKSDTNNLTKSISTITSSTVPPPTKTATNVLSTGAAAAAAAAAASGKKDVWGVGNTGSNLSYHLHAGLLALNLLPQDARPSLVFITDGVVKSNLQDEEVVRSFAKDDIPCTIIQVGSGQGFCPASNFGFVPDNEILRFLAAATGGKFIYSSDCKAITDSASTLVTVPSTKQVQPTFSTLLDTSAAPSPINTPTVDLFPTLTFALTSRTQPSSFNPPNFYHKHFLIRETSFFKIKSDTRYSSMGSASIGLSEPHVDVPREWYIPLGAGDGIENIHPSLHDTSFASSLNFPWDPKSQSPAVEINRVRYREYAIGSEVSQVIAARLRQGFTIHSVETSENGTGRGYGKPAKITISMVLLWLPNVTIEYNIKAFWLPIGATGTGGSACNIFTRTKAPRAEIYVWAHTYFAHVFADVGRKTGVDNSPVSAKVHKLYRFLSKIHETDDLLKGWTNFNTRWQQLSGRSNNQSPIASVAILASGQQSQQQQSPAYHMQKYLEAFKNYWESTERNDHRSSTKCWYDFAEIDVLVGHVSPYKVPNKASDYNEQYNGNAEDEITEAISIVEERLTSTWATFVSKDNVFVRIVQKNGNANASGTATPVGPAGADIAYNVERSYLHSQVPSFCELRFSRDTGCLVTLRILFFNVDLLTRRKTVDNLALKLSRVEWDRDGVSGARVMPSGNINRKWLIVCQRPLSHMLMRDGEHCISPGELDMPSASSSIAGQGQKHQHQQHQYQQSPLAAMRSNPWYIPSTLWLTSEFVVKNYLRHSPCSWLTDGQEDRFYEDAKIQDLAFQFLCQARLDQGYLLVSTQQHKNHFYQELNLGGSVLPTAIQYFVWKDPAGKINTELWMEPTGDRNLKDQLSRTSDVDRKIISQLVTFDAIHAIGRNHTKQVTSSGAAANTRGDPMMKLPKSFDLVSVLRLGRFAIAAYALPVYGIAERNFANRLFKFAAVEMISDRSPLGWGASDNLSSPLSEASTSDTGSLALGDSQHAGGASIGGVGHSRQTTTDTLQNRQNHRGHSLQLQKSSPMGSPAIDTNSAFPTPAAPDSMYAPKPDDLLIQHLASISKLEYARRDCALMHYFVEKSLTKLMDGEIVMAQHDTHDSFWDEMKKAMLATDNEHNILTAHHLIRNLRDTRCFVKIFDPQSFILILAPSLGIVVNALEKNPYVLPLPDHWSSEDAKMRKPVEYMGFLMFECVRQKPLRLVKRSTVSKFPSSDSIIELESFDRDKVTITPVPFLVEESDGLETTLRPTLFDGHYQTTQLQASPRTLRLTQDVSKLYARSFVKSVYSCLLQNHVVDADDFEKAMESCAESSMEIVITRYVNVQTLLKQNGAHRDDFGDIQDRFVSVLGHYFEPVNSSKDGHRSIFYYRPKNTRVNSKPGTTEMANVLHDIIGCAQEPLFIRLECTFKKPPTSPTKDVHEAEEVTFPVLAFPISYQITLDDGSKYDFDPTYIGTGACPVDSADGTIATLHLVCLTLPSTEDDVSDTPVDVVTAQSSLIDNMRSRPACLASLPPDKQEALAATEARLDWLLTEEIMHGLLRSGPVTQPVLDYIEAQLKKNVADFPTSKAMPLNFVRKKKPEERAITKAIFLEELAKVDILPYSLNRVGDCFYVSEDVRECDDSSSTTTLFASEITTNDNDMADDQNDDEETSVTGDGDNLYGLGITMTEQTVGRIVQKQLFWLLLIPQDGSVQIYFYSKAMHEVGLSAIIKRIQSMILQVEKRANQLILLKELNESHLCSKYLVVPESTSQTGDASEEFPDGEDGSPKDNFVDAEFEPGQLACPRVFSSRFPLHWRLKANHALNSIAAALHPMAVTNRSHMFVYPKDGSVVYIKLSEVDIVPPTMDSEGGDNDVRLTSSPYGSNLSLVTGTNSVPSTPFPLQGYTAEDVRPSPFVNGNSPRYSSTTSPGSRKPMQAKPVETRELVLDVFGVDPPGREITEGLVEMVEKGLINNTLRIIADSLARNPTFKLTSADVDFILPVEKNPAKRQPFCIPFLVRNPHTFLLYMRQNVLSSQLHALSGSDVVAAVKRHYASIYGFGTGFRSDSHYHDERSGKSQELLPGEFCFYYNMMVTKNPSHMTLLENSAGQGLAGICLTLLDPSGRPALQVPAQDQERVDGVDRAAVEACLDQPFYGSGANEEFSVVAEIWVMGSVNAGAILEHLEKCFRQSLCDYLVEMIISTDVSYITGEESELNRAVPTSIMADTMEDDLPQLLDPKIRTTLVEPCFSILKKAAEWQSPTAQELNLSASLAPWCMDDFLCELCDALTDMHSSFAPIIIKTQTSATDSAESKLEIYQPTRSRQDDEPHEPNVRFVVISGIKELSDKYGISSGSPSVVTRRRSIDSDKSHKSHRSSRSRSRRSSFEENDKASIAHSRKEDHASDKGSINIPRKDELASSHRKDSWTSIPYQQRTQLDGMTRYPGVSREGLARHCFLLMSLNGSNLVTYTYNWGDVIHEQMFSFINRTTSWHASRMNVLNSILHQKMGLFHHTDPIYKPIQPPAAQHAHSHNATHHPQQNAHHIAMQTPRLGFLSPNPSSLSVSRLAHVDGTGLRSNTVQISTPTNIPRPTASPQPIDGTNLNSLIYESFPPRLRAGNDYPRPEEGKRMPTGDSRMNDASSCSSLDVPERLAKSPIPTGNLARDSTRSVEVNKLLRDSIAESVTESLNAKAQDALLRHGPPFMETHSRQARIQQAHDNAIKIYTKWAKRYKDSKIPEQESESIATSDLAVILRSSRLLHFCRTPLLFTDSGNMGLEGVYERQLSTKTLEWYSLLTQMFMREYATYLETVGMQTVVFGATDSHLVEDMENTPFFSKFKISDELFVDCPAVFLLKVMQIGSIMCEVRIQGIFVCVTLYILHRRHGRLRAALPTFEKEEWIRQNFKMFTEECGKFKQRIHVNSFVYDFHLRYIQHTLDNHESASLSLNLLQVICAFAQSHPSPASYSRNRIFQGTFHVESDTIPEGLFDYILSNPEKYRFETLNFDLNPVACFLSSDFVDFSVSVKDDQSRRKQTGSSFRHTLLVYPADDSSSDSSRLPNDSRRVALQYFVIVTYQCSSQGADSVQATKVLKNIPGKTAFKPLEEVMTPENYTLGNIIDNAEKRLQKMIEEAVAFHSRDAQWGRLYRDQLHNSTLRIEDFTRLPQRFEILDLTTVDPQFRDYLQLPLNWHKILDSMRDFYKYYARESRQGDARHLVIFNTQCEDFLVHFQLRESIKVNVSVVSREKRSMAGKMEGLEKDHVSDIAKTFGYHLWRQVVPR